MTLKVLGAGLGRTGTMSLKVALEQLGFGPCFHMVEVFAGMPRTLELWEAVARGEPDWGAVFDGFAATVDYPGCTFWRELITEYPAAKVILTLRDPDSWFDSVSRSIFGLRSRTTIEASPAKACFEGTVLVDLDQSRMDDRAYMTGFFERWNAAVIAEVPPERLLVFEAREGWQPLCEFLGVPAPDAPYPRLNSSEEWAQRGTSSLATPPTMEASRETARARIAAMRGSAALAANRSSCATGAKLLRWSVHGPCARRAAR